MENGILNELGNALTWAAAIIGIINCKDVIDKVISFLDWCMMLDETRACNLKISIEASCTCERHVKTKI